MAHTARPRRIADAQKALAFQQTYGALKHRIDLFTALHPESLSRWAIQQAVDDIGRTKPEALA